MGPQPQNNGDAFFAQSGDDAHTQDKKRDNKLVGLQPRTLESKNKNKKAMEGSEREVQKSCFDCSDDGQKKSTVSVYSFGGATTGADQTRSFLTTQYAER